MTNVFFPIQLDARGNVLAMIVVALVGLALNLALMGVVAFVMAWAAAKGWAAA